jgi:hypothetical protein
VRKFGSLAALYQRSRAARFLLYEGNRKRNHHGQINSTSTWLSNRLKVALRGSSGWQPIALVIGLFAAILCQVAFSQSHRSSGAGFIFNMRIWDFQARIFTARD